MAAILVLFLGWGSQPGMPQTAKPGSGFSLTQQQASHFAALALKCVRKEYPNKPEHVLNGVPDVRSPKALHPAFYGCFDWHSSVHGHWMLVRLLRLFPDLPQGMEIRAALNENLTAESILAEVALSRGSQSAVLRAHVRLGMAS